MDIQLLRTTGIYGTKENKINFCYYCLLLSSTEGLTKTKRLCAYTNKYQFVSYNILNNVILAEISH